MNSMFGANYGENYYNRDTRSPNFYSRPSYTTFEHPQAHYQASGGSGYLRSQMNTQPTGPSRASYTGSSSGNHSDSDGNDRRQSKGWSYFIDPPDRVEPPRPSRSEPGARYSRHDIDTRSAPPRAPSRHESPGQRKSLRQIIRDVWRETRSESHAARQRPPSRSSHYEPSRREDRGRPSSSFFSSGDRRGSSRYDDRRPNSAYRSEHSRSRRETSRPREYSYR